MFLLFLLATRAVVASSEQQVQGDENPYLDEAGNLCQNKVETFQDTEYETMIQCRVAMKKTCTNQPIEEDEQAELTKPAEVCHTVYDKNCKTVYRPHRSKVRLREFSF